MNTQVFIVRETIENSVPGKKIIYRTTHKSTKVKKHIKVLHAITFLLFIFLQFNFAEFPLWEPYPNHTYTTLKVRRQDLIDTINNKVKRADSPDIILIGNSITFGWEKSGKDYWDAHFASMGAINMGIGSDKIQNMLYRLYNGNLDFNPGVYPKVVVCMLGTNNVNKTAGIENAEKVADGIRSIVQLIRRKLPYSKILLYGIFPRDRYHTGFLNPGIDLVNKIIQFYADNKAVYYSDIGYEFIKPDGNINELLMNDGLHPNKLGYPIWGEHILAKYAEMSKNPLKVLKIMPLGTSITEGVASESSYRTHLDTMLHQAGYIFDFVGSLKKHNNNLLEPTSITYDPDHEGHWGKTAGWLIPRVGDYVRKTNPHIVLLHVGTNDILHEENDQNPISEVIPRTINEISQIIDTLRAVNSTIKIALAQIIPNKRKDVHQFNLEIPKLAKEKSTIHSPVVVVDQWTEFNKEEDLVDLDHPNEIGAIKIAKNWIRAIDTLMQFKVETNTIATQINRVQSKMLFLEYSNILFFNKLKSKSAKIYNLKGELLMTLSPELSKQSIIDLLGEQEKGIGFIQY